MKILLSHLMTSHLWVAFSLFALTSTACNGQTVVYSNASTDSAHSRFPSPRQYFLDSECVLGIFVEGVLGKENEMPPIYYPENGSNVGPSTGYPVVVEENGQISLPLIPPIPVRGLTISQVEDLIRKRYQERSILTDKNRIMVSLIRKKTINVTVVRGDESTSQYLPGRGSQQSGGVNHRSDFSQRVKHLQLAEGDNDLLNALSLTGGLPGINAKPNIRIYRANGQNSSPENTPFPRTNFSRTNSASQYSSSSSLTKIDQVPVDRLYGEFKSNSQQQRIGSGDVVVVDPKPSEVFYTGGLLGGGQFSIPRDRNLDVLEAVSLAGGNRRNRNGLGPIHQIQPTELIVLRQQPGRGQVKIRVDLNQAYRNSAYRIPILPDDYLILQHTAAQRVRNVGIGTLNFYTPR